MGGDRKEGWESFVFWFHFVMFSGQSFFSLSLVSCTLNVIYVGVDFLLYIFVVVVVGYLPCLASCELLGSVVFVSDINFGNFSTIMISDISSVLFSHKDMLQILYCSKVLGGFSCLSPFFVYLCYFSFRSFTIILGGEGEAMLNLLNSISKLFFISFTVFFISIIPFWCFLFILPMWVCTFSTFFIKSFNTVSMIT